MSGKPSPAEENEQTSSVPEAMPAEPEAPGKEPKPPKPPKTPEDLLLAPPRSMQLWSTVFLLLSLALLLVQIVRGASDFGSGPLGALLLAAVWCDFWLKASRDYTVLKSFLLHPESFFWIQRVEPAVWCDLAPWRWFVRSRRLAFFSVGGARVETAVPVKRFDETVAWLRSLNAAALDFRPPAP